MVNVCVCVCGQIHLGHSLPLHLPGVTAVKRASVSGPASSHINQQHCEGESGGESGGGGGVGVVVSGRAPA